MPRLRRITGAADLATEGEPGSWIDDAASSATARRTLVGFSYGGWVAMNQAIRAPGRVASITLLDPAGLTKLDARFWFWLSISGLATLTPMPLRRRLGRWLDSPSMAEPELVPLMWAGIRGYHAEPKFPRVLTDDELRAIRVPTLLITGARPLQRWSSAGRPVRTSLGLNTSQGLFWSPGTGAGHGTAGCCGGRSSTARVLTRVWPTWNCRRIWPRTARCGRGSSGGWGCSGGGLTEQPDGPGRLHGPGLA